MCRKVWGFESLRGHHKIPQKKLFHQAERAQDRAQSKWKSFFSFQRGFHQSCPAPQASNFISLPAQATHHSPSCIKLYLSYHEVQKQSQMDAKAAKQLLKLERQIQRQIVDASTSLESMPECPNVKALAHHRYGFRLRVGNFRVLFDWHTVIKIVDIQEVKKRDENTY